MEQINLDRIICPGCGWTGEASNLGEWGQCPKCKYEFDDCPLMTVREILESELVYNDVRLDLFLKTLLKPNGDNSTLDGYPGILEAEIENQANLLVKYISHKNWIKAGQQQEYINGLAQALHLAMVFYVATAKNSGDDTK